MSEFGRLVLTFALGLGIYNLIAATAAGRRFSTPLLTSARNGLLGVAVLMTGAVVTLLLALLTHDFSIRYVAENSSLEMPRIFIFTALWGGQAGSLLFWAWMLSVFGALAVWVHFYSEVRLIPWVIAVISTVQVFFLVVLNFLTNPFEKLPVVLPNGRGLNPLLQDPGMLFHPPLLLSGYMSWSIPFAFATAALITGRLDREWLTVTRAWAMLAWLIQGAGLIVGGWWAYHVLGWGGYWGWDPVENVALLPWLVGTAFIHSLMVQERRGMLKLWNFGLIIAAFNLSIFGTFIVRSGVLTSVHSFAQSSVGPAFFTFLGMSVVASVALVIHRLPVLRAQGDFESLLSREAAFLLNNLLLVGIAFATLWGTVFPLLSEAVRGEKLTVGPPFYNQVNGPLLLALVLLMGVGPLLGWRKTGLRVLLRDLLGPALFGLGVIAGLYTAGIRLAEALLGFWAVAFVAGTVFLEFYRAVRVRRRAMAEGVLTALLRVIGRNRRRYGGYIVHLGILILAVGVIGSNFFRLEREFTVRPGETFSLGRYTLRFEQVGEWTEPGVRNVGAAITLLEPFERELLPYRKFYRNWEQTPASHIEIVTVVA
jgi:cytochrome c-type biogenesis protein CcmF